MIYKLRFYGLVSFFLIYFSGYSQQTETTTLRAMMALKNPSSTISYRVTDMDKTGEWRYDAADNQSVPNIGTILGSTNRNIKGRFKRVFQSENGVNIDWFINNSGTINDGLLKALMANEKINFGNKTYQIAAISISPTQLKNPNRAIFNFNNTTLQTQSGFKKVNVISIQDIPALALLGNLTLDGNAFKSKIVNLLTESGEAFLKIISPSNNPISKLDIGRITIKNMPMCGITIDTHDNLNDLGYDKISVGAFREINGFNQLNIQQENFAIWGVNVRGAHRVVLIDSLFAQQDNEPWGDAGIEKSFYTFTFENQVDPTINKRKDSLYIKNLYANYACSLVLYTQAVNHVLIDNYVLENTLRKPNVADGQAYPTMLQKNISWIGSKHTWTSYKCPNCGFRVKKLLIKNTNLAFMNESVLNDMTGLWLNKAISGAVFDEIETDVRIKLYGDGFYFDFADVPDGGHFVKKFISRIPAKRNYVQPLNADLTIDRLQIAKGNGVTFAMGNAKIKSITQEEGSKAIFENRENKFKNSFNKYDGFVVDSCTATNIIWKFNWAIDQKKLSNLNAVAVGERYEFKNFAGQNYLETNTTFTATNGKSNYITAYRYDGDAASRTAIQQFLQFVEFSWNNVSMKISDSSSNNLTLRYVPISSNKNPLLMANPNNRSMKGWQKNWQKNSFIRCEIR